MSRFRIAMLGSRGVPATYGGIERHIEELGARLVERGHVVTVYCRRDYTSGQGCDEYRGMRTVALPAVRSKHFEALSHTALASARAVLGRHDIYHFHALGPGLFTLPTRLAAAGSTVLTVHGLDQERAKWGPLAGRMLRGAEWAAVRGADTTVVVAPNLVDHYRQRYGLDTEYVPNGVTRTAPAASRRDGRYLLFVGRLTPEKRPDLLIRAFRRLADPDLRLIVVGGTSHTDGFVDELRRQARADPRVELCGYVYGQDLADLYAGARLFVQPSALEGMPLTLLEAAAHGAPLLTSDIAVHRTVIGDLGPGRRMFRTGSEHDLVRVLGEMLDADEGEERRAAEMFGAQVTDVYSWDRAVDRLEEIYHGCARSALPAIPVPRQRVERRSVAP